MRAGQPADRAPWRSTLPFGRRSSLFQWRSQSGPAGHVVKCSPLEQPRRRRSESSTSAPGQHRSPQILASRSSSHHHALGFNRAGALPFPAFCRDARVAPPRPGQGQKIVAGERPLRLLPNIRRRVRSTAGARVSSWVGVRMEVGDAHRHQHLRLCEVHGPLVSADGGAAGVGIRRAGPSPWPQFRGNGRPRSARRRVGRKDRRRATRGSYATSSFSPGLTRPRLQMPQ